jgi:hypothetical protein
MASLIYQRPGSKAELVPQNADWIWLEWCWKQILTVSIANLGIIMNIIVQDNTESPKDIYSSLCICRRIEGVK